MASPSSSLSSSPFSSFSSCSLSPLFFFRCLGHCGQILLELLEEPLQGLQLLALLQSDHEARCVVLHEDHLLANLDGHDDLWTLGHPSCSSLLRFALLDALPHLTQERNSARPTSPESGTQAKSLFDPICIGCSLEVHTNNLNLDHIAPL